MNTENGNGNGHGSQGVNKGHKWKKGQSGNPSGRRKGTVSLTAALKRTLTPKTLNAIARKLERMALAGDAQAIKLIWERLDGKPSEKVELSGPEGGSIPHEFTIIGITSEELTTAFPTRSE